MKEIISRKEAIQKLGKYSKFTALTAFGTFAILNPLHAMQQSCTDCDPLGFGIFNPNGNNGSGIWGADNRYNRFKNEGFRVPFSNDTQYGPFQSNGPVGPMQSGGASTPFSGRLATPPSGNTIWK
jgi:hypothetical protein